MKYGLRVTHPSTLTGQVGLHAVAKIIGGEMNWAFQAHSDFDYGIDAMIEELLGEGPTGRAIALQIKSGHTYFREKSPSGNWILRIEKRHLEYWLSYQAPVVVVLYDPDSDLAYWAHVDERTARFTANKAVVEVSRTQILCAQTNSAFAKISDSWQPARSDATSIPRRAISGCLTAGCPVVPTTGLWQLFGRASAKSRVLVHNLPLEGTAPVVRMAQRSTAPFIMSGSDLSGLWLVPAGTEIYVLENPGSLEYVASHLGRDSPALVCTFGFPNAAAEYLMLGLGFCLAQLYVHTDHDTVGQQIIQTLLHRTIDYKIWCPKESIGVSTFEESCVAKWVQRLKK